MNVSTCRDGVAVVSLPPVPQPFVGREHERGTISDLLKTHRVVSVEGPAGIGKTALLTAFGSALSRRHRVVYLALPRIPSAEELWSHLRVNLLCPQILGTPDRVLPHQVLHSLDQSRTILLLDDAENLPQSVLADFLADCLTHVSSGRLVFSSRCGLPLPEPCPPDVAILPLAGLSEEESLELVSRISRERGQGLDRRDCIHIHRLFGGNPLALRLCLAHPHIIEPKVAVRERSGYALDLATELLPPLLRGVSDRQIDLIALGAVAGQPVADEVWAAMNTRPPLLAELTHAMLAERRPSGIEVLPLVSEAVLDGLDRKRLFDLRHQLASAFERAWERSCEKIQWLHKAIDLFIASGEHAKVAVLLERHRGRLLEHTPREYLARLAELPAEVKSTFPRLELDQARLMTMFHGPNALSRALLNSLFDSEDRERAAEASVELADLEYMEGNRDRALAHCRRALTLTQGRQDLDHFVARVLLRQASLKTSSGPDSTASDDCVQAIDIFKRSPDRLGCSEAFGVMGQIAEADGDLSAAVGFYRQALRLQRAADHPGFAGTTLTRLGLCYADRGQYRQALSCLKRASADLNVFGDRLQAAQVQIHRAEVLSAMGTYNRARPLFVEGLSILREATPDRFLASALLSSGLSELESGDLKAAARSLEQSLDLFSRLSDGRGSSAVQTVQAQLMRQTGNRAGARVLLEGLLVEARRNQWETEVAEIQFRLASQAVEEGDLQAAQEWSRHAMASYEAQGKRRAVDKVRALLIRVAFLGGDLKAAHEMAGQEAAAARAHSDLRGLAMALTQLAEVRLDQGRTREALRLAREALSIRQRSGDPRGVVASLRLLTEALIQQGSLSAARRIASRGMELARELTVASERAYILLLQGILAVRSGRPPEARAFAEELNRQSTGMLELQLLGLKLAEVAYTGAGEVGPAKRCRADWIERIKQLPRPRARRLHDTTTRLGLEVSSSEVDPSLTSRDRRILAKLSRLRQATVRELADHLGLSAGILRRALRALVASGLVRCTGRGRTTAYAPHRLAD